MLGFNLLEISFVVHHAAHTYNFAQDSEICNLEFAQASNVEGEKVSIGAKSWREKAVYYDKVA